MSSPHRLRRTARWAAFSAFLALTAVACSKHAGEEPRFASVEVTVKHQDGSPADSVFVYLTADFMQVAASGWTNAQGTCRLYPVNPGDYVLFATMMPQGSGESDFDFVHVVAPTTAVTLTFGEHTMPQFPVEGSRLWRWAEPAPMCSARIPTTGTS